MVPLAGYGQVAGGRRADVEGQEQHGPLVGASSFSRPWALAFGFIGLVGALLLATTPSTFGRVGLRPNVAALQLKAEAPAAMAGHCSRADGKAHLCKLGNKDTCTSPLKKDFGFKDGTCADAGYPYCWIGAFAMEGWTDEKGSESAFEAMTKAGYANDGCQGKGKPLPCHGKRVWRKGGPAVKAGLCRRVEEKTHECRLGDKGTCQSSLEKDFGFDDGSCEAAGYPHCWIGAMGAEVWTDGTGCDAALGAMAKAGYANDGCRGKSKPLPCGNRSHSTGKRRAKDSCRRIDKHGCSQFSGSSCAIFAAKNTKPGTCQGAGYPFCWKGGWGIKVWADENGCKAAWKSMKKAGYPNDGCDGLGKPLPCGAAVDSQ